MTTVGLISRTALPIDWRLLFDRDGSQRFVAIVRATYALSDAGPVQLAEQQMPVVSTDVCWGDPATTSIRYEADLALRKPFIDVIVNGFAQRPGGRKARRLVTELRVGRVRKRLVVHGDRQRWFGMPGLARRFEQMPIVYERARGGTDRRRADPKTWRSDPRNPYGTGYRKARGPTGSAYENIEPSRSFARLRRRAPASYGFLPRLSSERVRYAGTYDQRWLDERFPLPPRDFDDRYYQGAPRDQWLERLEPGQPVLLRGLHSEGDRRFELPELAIPYFARYDHERREGWLRADTLLIEPDEERLFVTSRIDLPTGHNTRALREVIVGDLTRGERRAFATGKRYRPLGSSRPAPSAEDLAPAGSI